jgi:two-component system sensor histidine kinase KdpD
VPDHSVPLRVGHRFPEGLGPWTVVLGFVTTALWALRDDLSEVHKTLALLLVVLGASARHGRGVGLTLAGASFLAFDFFLLPPYYTLRLANPLDWTVLFGFLVTAAVAAELFHRGQEARSAAERAAREAEHFAAMASESLAAPTAADAMRVVTNVMRSELPLELVLIFGIESGGPKLVARMPEDGALAIDPGLVSYALRAKRLVSLEADSTTHVAADQEGLASLLLETRSHVAVIVPLYIRDRPIGAVCMADVSGLAFDRSDVAFAEGFIRYAALALERARLAGEAEHVAALVEADRLKDAFVASVSHDLRTPLTTIRAMAAEMRDAEPDRASIVIEEVDRLNRIVSDLLDLSRVRAGALPLDVQVIAAEDVVGAALHRIAGLPGRDRVAVTLPPDGTLPAAQMDFVQTLRILTNLLENALKHAPGSEPVELVVLVEGNDLVFRVLDRGPGIPEAEAGRVFAPFSVVARSDGSPTGSGLGLAIARSLAEGQGGSLEYRRRDGGGSVFTLRLPAAAIPDLP